MLLTSKQLRAHLQISLPTFSKLKKRGMPRIAVTKQVIRYDVEEVERWLKGQEAEVKATASSDQEAA